MGCGASVRVNLRTKKEDPKAKNVEPVIQYGTYQFKKNCMYSETHNLYVVDASPLEEIPPPHVPPILKNEIFKEEDYEHIDKRALDVPTEKNKGSLAKLVKYLIKTTKEDEVGMIRALFTWLVARNINDFKIPLQPPKEHSVVYYLSRLKLMKSNYAQMLSFMCRMANIPCVVLHGYLKGSTYTIGQSVEKNKAMLYGEWNAVLINNTWRLINPYWAACAIGSDPTEADTTYKVDETFFLTDPEILAYSHFPEEPVWQLIDRPITIRGFERRAFVKERFFELGMRILSHPSCEVTAVQGEIELLFGIPPNKMLDLDFTCLVFRNDYNVWKELKDGQYQHHFIYFPNEHSIGVKIRFPTKGNYKLEMFGRDMTIKDKYYETDWVAIYKIRANETSPYKTAFPRCLEAGWGPNIRLHERGLHALSHPHAMVNADGDSVDITFGIEDIELGGNLDIKYKCPTTTKGLDELPFEKKWLRKEQDQYVIDVQAPPREELALCVFILDEGMKEPVNVCNYLVLGCELKPQNRMKDIESIRQQVVDATEEMKLNTIERVLDLMETKDYEEEMKTEANNARIMARRLRKLHEIMHGALAIPNSAITEIADRNSPAHELHEVMKATFLMLGNFEEETRIWPNVQELLRKTENDYIRIRIWRFRVKELQIELALGAKKMLDRLDRARIEEESEAAANLFDWVNGMIEEKFKRSDPEKVAVTLPRTHELGGPGAPTYRITTQVGKVHLYEI